MENALATDPSHEGYVIEIDGIPRFEYRVFIKALSVGLQLKHDFPNCRVKVRDADDGALPLKH
jgi:hypothetical protein